MCLSSAATGASAVPTFKPFGEIGGLSWRTGGHGALHRGMMLAMQIRPSVKFIMLGYVLCVLAEIAAGVVVYGVEKPADPENYMLAISVVILILAFFLAVRHIQRRVTKITVLTDRLRYESGMFSKTTRTVELAKVQDVRVDQTLGQRMMNMGSISLETAGSSSRLVMNSIDSPQAAADHILELRARGGEATLINSR